MHLDATEHQRLLIVLIILNLKRENQNFLKEKKTNSRNIQTGIRAKCRSFPLKIRSTVPMGTRKLTWKQFQMHNQYLGFEFFLALTYCVLNVDCTRWLLWNSDTMLAPCGPQFHHVTLSASATVTRRLKLWHVPRQTLEKQSTPHWKEDEEEAYSRERLSEIEYCFTQTRAGLRVERAERHKGKNPYIIIQSIM